MQRTITVSTDVFATIWAHRQPGEETENDILSRILQCGSDDRTPTTETIEGVFDTRNNVSFRKGFTATRSYKGKEYRAIADNNVWIREDTGKRYDTLNQLNASITAGNENVWNGNWKYLGPDGKLVSIDRLRP
jgi:hypothetical protein